MPALQISTTELKRLYHDELLSARQIAERNGVSLDAVYYLLRRYNIPCRSHAENRARAFMLKKPSFVLKEKLTTEEKKLKTLGVALYWAEGYKTQKSKTVDLANSDPYMIMVFLAFLRKVCGVDEKRFRVYLYCHSEKNISAYIRYWSKITGIPKTQFSKPYVPKRISKRDKGMPNGLIHVRYSDKKLLNLIREWITNLSKQYCVGGGVVKHTGL